MTWILFDYGNVICHPQVDTDLALMASAARCTVPELSDAYWSYRQDYDRGVLDGPMFWQKIGATVGQSYSAGQIAELIRLDSASWLHLQDETLALIEELGDAGHRLALLSNAPANMARVISALPFAARFEHMAFSGCLKTVKPDPEVFRTVLSQLGASPADVIFVDDRPENVAAAAALGMRAVHFTTAEQARTGLAGYGVLAI
jgi:putative hydrolase of the HAD superfamily